MVCLQERTAPDSEAQGHPQGQKATASEHRAEIDGMPWRVSLTLSEPSVALRYALGDRRDALAGLADLYRLYRNSATIAAQVVQQR